MAYQNLLVSFAEGIARITLNRPDRLNSFTAAMHAEMRQALADLHRRADLRVLILAGAGRGFCAGQDLQDRAVLAGAEAPDLGASIEKNYAPLILALRALPAPVIAKVNGVAAGAGANLALACDLVIAARSASFIQAFCKIGLIPDTGGTLFLPQLVGTARAMGLALLGEKLGAPQAEQWGLIWKCVDDEKLDEEVDALARHFAAAPTKALARTKEAIQAASNRALADQLALEANIQRELGRGEDYREGVAAFMAKRAPRFRGD
ncbi:MAG: 2-(1,2-epoxy-1,2-dihydrophenyl)acetyl-CoA isomerase [Betaproteobacteria bacterium]|nr:2-(1,2-epoxy-1,2-dihydrophenyl)acetyl-CoA isomerase [Betaproteobacteria bacterium]